MSTPSLRSLTELSPELFAATVEHLPLIYRPPTLLSLALTCSRLHHIVNPVLLYNSLRLNKEDQAMETLNTLISKAELVTEEDIQTRGNPSLSHCIRHLSLYTMVKALSRRQNSVNALKKLIEMNGLRHLQSLSLELMPRNDDGSFEDMSTGRLMLSSSFLSSLKIGCPNLKSISLRGITQDYQEDWIAPYLFSFKSLTGIHVYTRLINYPTSIFDLSQLPTTNLHTVELRIVNQASAQSIDATSLLQCVIPNLRTLILDCVHTSDHGSLAVNAFWCAHPGIERLELCKRVFGKWLKDLDGEALTNVKHLLCSVHHARDFLPRVSNSLISLSIYGAHNTQVPYLLRVLSPGGVLPNLRSLSIHSEPLDNPISDWESIGSDTSDDPMSDGDSIHSETSDDPILFNWDIWREDENGEVSLGDPEKPGRKYDGNYIMSLAKAAPNLEELELMGESDDTLESITTSLSMFPMLSRLTLSGGINYVYCAFFPRSRNWKEYTDLRKDFGFGKARAKDYGKYAPSTFEKAAHDLGNGCRTLEVITMGEIFRDLAFTHGLSCKVVRWRDGGKVKGLRKIKAYGNIIGREDEW